MYKYGLGMCSFSGAIANIGVLSLTRTKPNVGLTSGVVRNLIWGVYVLTSHCNFKTCVNVPHVNKTVRLRCFIHRCIRLALE